MIILKELTWDNCFSYGENNNLELDNSGLTQIVGINGTGKSSIPLIIEEVLYNKNSKGVKKADISNRHINKGYNISLTWQKDEDIYKISAVRKASIKVKLFKNGEDISSHTATNTYKTVQDLLGIDFKTFSQLVYQSSTSNLQFLTATDTNRKKFLIDLLHLEEYVKLFEVFKDAAKELNTETISIKSKIATVEKWLFDNKLTDITILPMLTLDFDTEDTEKEIQDLRIEIVNISKKNKLISQNNKYKELLKQIDLKELESNKITKKESYDVQQTKLGAAKAILDSSQLLIKKLKRLGDTCPTCEQKVDTVFKQSLIDQEHRKIEQAEMKSLQLNKIIEKVKENNKLFEHYKSIQRDWEDLYRSIDPTLPSKLLEETKLNKKLKELTEQVKTVKQSINEILSENERRTRQNTRIQVIQEQTDAFIEDLIKHQKLLKSREELLFNLEILKKAFSTNGLLAYKIENLVKELEELVNEYLAELSDGRFTLEFIINNDKLNVQITDDGNVVDITTLSTGELARVNTATLIAIRKLMSSISDSKINILFLDEVIGVLDMEGREKLIELLLNEPELNTFLVSHNWTHPLIEKIEVQKVDNISRLER
jgi:DNA repair exonuclease SbcCD ATPase subunit